MPSIFHGASPAADAELEALPEQLKAVGTYELAPCGDRTADASDRRTGPVNLAALDELTQTAERKNYLDAQALDLTEAMTTLESAIKQIDRESRDLLQQTSKPSTPVSANCFRPSSAVATRGCS